jgi:hypothetical protein
MGFGSGIVEPESAMLCNARNFPRRRESSQMYRTGWCARELMPGMNFPQGKRHAALGLKVGYVSQVQVRIVAPNRLDIARCNHRNLVHLPVVQSTGCSHDAAIVGVFKRVCSNAKSTVLTTDFRKLTIS